MSAPYSNTRSKLNRAIAARLVAAEAGTAADVLPANTTIAKSFPNTVIQSTVTRPEVPLTGLSRIRVAIRIRATAAENPDTGGDPDAYEAARRAFDERIAKTKDALMLSEVGSNDLHATALAITTAGRALATSTTPAVAAANADMPDFTCTAWYDAGEGDGEPDEENTYWEEILLFDAVACPSNVD